MLFPSRLHGFISILFIKCLYNVIALIALTYFLGIKGFKEALQGGDGYIEKVKKWEMSLADYLLEFLFLNYETAIYEVDSSQQKEIQLFTLKGNK
jgi:hypothetical protein